MADDQGPSGGGGTKHASAMEVAFGSPASTFAFGIEYDSGEYFRAPMSSGSFAWHVSGKKVVVGGGREPRPHIDPDDLSSAGWGVLWADAETRAQVEPLLKPLLVRRQEEAGERFASYTYDGESARDFLNGTGAVPGAADPERSAPYYLMLVGEPSLIPFEFQQQLDLRYAVGRLSFENLEDYGSYARSVVSSEESATGQRQRRAAFFGVENGDDPVTEQCVAQLVKPLAEEVSRQKGWSAEQILGEAADKAALSRLLMGDSRSSILVTAGHSPVLSPGDSKQRELQGGIITSAWPGPGSQTALKREAIFSADDLPENADLHGMVMILVGCFSAGTPRYDGFAESDARERAPSPFVARLPQRLLSKGVLAAVAHVDSLFLHSFAWPGSAQMAQHQTYGDMLFHLMKGQRLGHAMDTFGRRYGELSTYLISARLDPGSFSEEEYSAYWIGYHDARQYVVLGDPAVRLNLVEGESEQGHVNP